MTDLDEQPPAATSAVPAVAGNDPLDLLDEVPLTGAEAGYVAAARAANTLRGYRSDWAEFTAWCAQHGLQPLPPGPATVTGYLTDLARHGAKVGTMSRRLSAIRFAARLRNTPDPTANARVIAVWEGIRRTHGAPPVQAAPLMPPELFDVLAACPINKAWKTRGRPPEPDLAGLRDRALLLVGFVAALRRSELAALHVDHVAEHPNGAVLTLPRSKTNQTGEQTELVVLPRAGNPARCPVTTLHALAARRRDHRRAGVPPGQHRQPRPAPAAAPRIGQHPHPERRRPRRPRPHPVQRAQPPRRLRHLRPPPRRHRPGHRPPNPPPQPRHPRRLRPHPHRLDRQRRHPTRAVAGIRL